MENVAAAKADESLKLHLTPAAITKTGTGTLDDLRAIAQKQPGLYAVAYHPIGGRLIPEKTGAAGQPAQHHPRLRMPRCPQ
ncbi:MAG: hypothetical protein ACLUZX_11600 [Subdoligranulum sp.]